MDVLINVLGGVALLLWGIRMVRTGFTRSYGAAMRRVIGLSGKNRVTAFGAGLIISTILQSSTASAMVASSFVRQGLLGGAVALAVMLGADVGTTVVVQIVAFDIGWLSPLLLAAGVCLFLSSEKSRRKNLGRIAIGLGLVLLAMKLIVLASVPLRETATLSLLLQPLYKEPLLALLIMAALTWLSHSSVAMVLVVMSLASAQVLSFQFALVLVLGINCGAGLPAAALTFRAPAAVRRLTFGNLAMRATGAIAALPLVPYVVPYLGMFSDGAAHSLAVFHSGFNIALSILFIPVLGLVASVMSKMITEGPESNDPGMPRYLDYDVIETPAVAISCAEREALRMGDEVNRMLRLTQEVFRKDDDDLRKQIERSDDLIDRLHEAIKLYLTALSREELDAQESTRCVEILSFTTNLEHIGDIVDKNLMDLAARKIKKQVSFSAEGVEEIETFHTRILANLDLAISTFMSGNLDLARNLLREKSTIRDLERRFTDNHFVRIGEGRPESILTSALHLDILRDLKRINSHVTSVAYPILERAGELAESRLVTAETQPVGPLSPVRDGQRR